jgi:hypothetical protein
MGVGPEPGFKYFVEEGAFSRTSESSSIGSRQIEIIGISELVLSLPKITYLSLDIEGGELDILKAYPWKTSTPCVITVEHNNAFKVEADMENLLKKLGYRRVLGSLSGFESWYVHVA